MQNGIYVNGSNFFIFKLESSILHNIRYPMRLSLFKSFFGQPNWSTIFLYIGKEAEVYSDNISPVEDQIA